MNEFLPRTEPIASNAERMPAGVRTVPAVVALPGRTDTTGLPNARRAASGQAGAFAVMDDDRVGAAVAYAQVHSRIVTVLADLKAQAAPAHPALLDSAEHSLLSLMPQPVVVLPLPPANRDMVEFVVQVTQSIARQAAQTRAAQSSVSAAMVDAAVA